VSIEHPQLVVISATPFVELSLFLHLIALGIKDFFGERIVIHCNRQAFIIAPSFG
jgi:hypothetical protein